MKVKQLHWISHFEPSAEYVPNNLYRDLLPRSLPQNQHHTTSSNRTRVPSMHPPILLMGAKLRHQRPSPVPSNFTRLTNNTQDWALLSSIILPTLHIDYRSVMGPTYLFPSMPSASYIAMMSNPATLGNPLVGTQHLLGASTFERNERDGEEIVGTWQLRAHHVRFAASKLGLDDGDGGRGREVLATATGSAVIKHFYRRDERGQWKLAGLQPTVLFDEGDLKALFAMP